MLNKLFSSNKKKKFIEEDVKYDIETSSQDFSEKLINEEELKEKELIEKIISAESLSEEQIERINNIYSDTGEKIAYLTFDDGPSEVVTPQILDTLKSEKIKATFFVLGNRVGYYPEIVKREFQEGHYIANHGYTHQYNLIYQSVEDVIDEYNKTEDVIKQALQNEKYKSNLFRFPGRFKWGKI